MLETWEMCEEQVSSPLAGWMDVMCHLFETFAA
jgi:hypothetical protein